MPSAGSAVFGYGSLIFKPPPFDLDFKSGNRTTTAVRRKTPGEDDPLGSHHVWGRIYYIPPERSEEIWTYLDIREKDGYSLRTVDVYNIDEEGKEVVVEKGVRVYVGETHNPSFGGGEPMASLAAHIAKTAGPSGPNKEYLYKLCEAVRQLDPHSEDAYLKELERLVRLNDPEHSDKASRHPSRFSSGSVALASIMSSRARSSSKKRLSSFISRAITPSNSESKKAMPPFSHIKFSSGRPPEFAGQLPFAHELDPAKDPLADSLKTDVQREGVLRYLRNNFGPGSYVHDVVHERERDSMYVLLCANWRRSTGDPKLHLSLYIYQHDAHVATWHAYTDRSVSYSRMGDENDPPPDGADPYTTPEALATALSAAPVVVPSSPTEERPRFNRPAAAPESGDEAATPVKKDRSFVPPVQQSVSTPSRSSRSKKEDRLAPAPKEDWDAPPPEDDELPPEDWIKPPVGGSEASDDGGAPPRKSTVEVQEERPSRSSRAKKPEPSSSEDEREDYSKPAYPVVKSKPIARIMSRSAAPTPDSRSRSRSSSPPPSAKDAQRARRARSVARQVVPQRTATAPLPTTSHISLPLSLSTAEESFLSLEAGRATSVASSSSRFPLFAPSAIKKRLSESLAIETELEGKLHIHSHHSRSTSSPPPSSARASCRRHSVSPSRSASPASPKRDPRGRSPPRPSAPPASAPPLDRAPSWRSVSRNRHRREDDSDEDTLVRGDVDDHALDIPAGGEVSLLDAKRRSASKDRSARRARHAIAKDEAFDPAQVEKPPPPPEKPTAKAVFGSWIKSVGALLKTEGELAVGEVEEKVVQLEVDEEEARAKRKEERRKRREARAARRAARETDAEELAAQTAAEEEVEERRKEAELKRREQELKKREEKLRREDERLKREEAEQALATSRSSKSSRRAKRADSDEEAEAEARARGRREEPVKETKRASSRRPRQPLSASEEEIPQPRLSRREEPVEPDRFRIRASRHRHHGSSNVESPAELEAEPEPPRPPPRRQRAASISTGLDAGLKNLRQPVAKIVSNAGEVEAEARENRDREGRRRKIASDSEEEQERAMLARSRQPSRSRHGETDGEAGRSSRRRKPPSPSTPSEGDLSGGPGHRHRTVEDDAPLQPSRSSRSRQPPRPAYSDSEASEAAHPPSRPAPPPVPRYGVSGDSDSNTVLRAPRLPSPPKLRQQRRPPPSASNVSSDTDAFEVSSRPSSRGTVRSESEGDTEAHRLAKRNAAINSTTIPAETIRQLRNDQFARGVRSVPGSPATSRPPAFPDGHGFEHSSNKLLREIEQATTVFHHDRAKPAGKGDRQGRRTRDRYSDSDSSADERFSARKPDRQSQRAFPAVPAPVLSPPSSERVPPIPSPVSPGGQYTYAFDASSAPLRPQPIRPASGGPSHLARIHVPVPSTAGSSDEGDPSRSTSSLHRERRGYRTGDSESDAPPTSSSRRRDPPPPPQSTNTSPYPRAFDSDSDGASLAYSRGGQRSTRQTRSPSPSPSPPRRREQQQSRRAPSFSRSQQPDAYLFGDSEDELSCSDGDSLASSRFGPSSSNAASASAPSASVRGDIQRRSTCIYSDDSASEYGGGSSKYGSARPAATDRQPSAGAGRNGSSSRTMVGNPAAGSTSRTMVSSPPSGFASPFSRHPPFPLSGGSRTVVSSSSRSGAPTRPTISPTSSSSAYPPPPDLFEREGPSGFTGFDLRGAERDERDEQMEREKLARMRVQGRKSGSAQVYGANQAPVSRRMARRLGM
ncbi:hypothetical protein JCM10213v2_006869 [Rhodosporidiobolus nylandii]